MRLTMPVVMARLRSEGLASRADEEAVEAVLAREAGDHIPWYVRIAVGAGAWAATAFLLAFLFAINVLEGDVPRIAVGTALLSGSVIARRRAAAEFIRHAAVAGALAGQGLAVMSVGALTDSGVQAGIAGLLVSLGMIAVMPDRLHRFLSVLVATGCAVVIVADLRWHAGLEVIVICLVLLAGWSWRFGLRDWSVDLGEIMEPVGYGLLVAAFAVLLFGGMTSGLFVAERTRGWEVGPATTLVIAGLLALLVLAIVRERGASTSSAPAIAAVGAIALLAAATLSSPGIIAGLAVLVLGFDRRNPLLIGIAALFLLHFGSVYYYSLGLTLMEKAGVLMASGAVLLGARAVIVRQRWGGEVSG